MILTELTTVPAAALPLEPFKAHLRMGSGFGEDTLQDVVLESFLRAAIAAVEARTSKILITRSFRWVLSAWRDRCAQPLPVAPVGAVTLVTLIDRDDAETVVDSSEYRIDADAQSPKLRPTGALLPDVPTDGSVQIHFDAGLAADWGSLPADLAQAVLMLAAHYYEYRNDTSLGDGCMPFGVTSLLQRYRPMRVGFGA